MSTNQIGPWHVFDRALSDGSKVYHLRLHDEDNRYHRRVRIDCASEDAAYRTADALNAAMLLADGRLV